MGMCAYYRRVHRAFAAALADLHAQHVLQQVSSVRAHARVIFIMRTSFIAREKRTAGWKRSEGGCRNSVFAICAWAACARFVSALFVPDKREICQDKSGAFLLCQRVFDA